MARQKQTAPMKFCEFMIKRKSSAVNLFVSAHRQADGDIDFMGNARAGGWPSRSATITLEVRLGMRQSASP
jgi:hypothetical protein